MRYPDRLQPRRDREVQFRERQLRFLERHDRHAHQARIVRAEIDHVTVVCARGPIAKPGRDLRAGPERGVDAVGREHELLFEAEHVQRARALASVEGSQSLNLLRGLDQAIAEAQQLGYVLRAMPPAARHDHRDFLIGDERGAVAHRRHLVAQVRVRVPLQEIRQLHDMAVGVIERPVVGRIRHGKLLPRVPFGRPAR